MKTTIQNLANAFVALCVVLCSYSIADSVECHRCGAHSACQRCCRLVVEEKKVTVTCWGIKDEEFCIGAPSCEKCEKCETVCNCKPDDKGVKTGPKTWSWKIWEPSTSAYLFTKHKLMKRTETKTVPSYKWVVEDLCSECQAQTPEASVVK